MQRPGDTHRLAVIGATGSGKTQASLWHLSEQDFSVKPWIIYDFKGEEMINSIAHAQHISLNAPIPSRPGLYVVHPLPDQEEIISDHMTEIWKREDIGVFIDEGYMLGNNNAGFRYLLTQGRSKHIPVIVCLQRPVWADRYVFSEASYFQVFRLQNRKDLATVQEFIPFDISERLPEYHSYYYGVAENEVLKLGPTPDRDAILDTFDSKLRRLKKII
jgi:hypothetical protein